MTVKTHCQIMNTLPNCVLKNAKSNKWVCGFQTDAIAVLP